MTTFFKPVGDVLSAFFYPAGCICCNKQLEEIGAEFCKTCLDQLQLICVKGRCKRCFSYTGQRQNGCGKCRLKKLHFSELGSCFTYAGPAKALIRELKQNKRTKYAKKMAPYLYLQYTKLQWEKPDYLVPVPTSKMHQLRRGFNQAKVMADELSTYLEVPVLDCLKRSGDVHIQTHFSKEEREKMPYGAVEWEEKAGELLGKKVILIDDVTTTGRTLSVCVARLKEGRPSQVRALTFSKA